MKSLFGSLFVLTLLISIGCIYCYAQWQHALDRVEQVQEDLRGQEAQFQYRIDRAVTACESLQQRICDSALEATRRTALREGEAVAAERCEARVEKAVEAAQQAEITFAQQVDSMKLRYSLALSRQKEAHQAQLHQLREEYEHKVASLSKRTYFSLWPALPSSSRKTGYLANPSRMNWFVGVMILLTPFLAGLIQRIIGGRRGRVG